MMRKLPFLGICLLGLLCACTPEKRITSPPTGNDTVIGPCSANCASRECGSDGCGGYCGTCPQGTACDPQGLCAAKPCTPQCSGKLCGADGCGGSCGTCPQGTGCNGVGKCTTGTGCTPNCTGKVCGPDGCGNYCGKCPSGFMCNETSQCVVDPSACSNLAPEGECQQNDLYAVRCSNGQLLATYCDPALGLKCGYNAGTGFMDCIKGGCAPNCTNKQCGADGCGGVCGVCPPTENCNSSGQCSNTCTPDCVGKFCGPNGCGGECGICDPGYNCSPAGQCIDPNSCLPNCTGKLCGADGCGDTCGTCSSGLNCESGQCVTPAMGCVPNCINKNCGNDGCGGSCGTCSGVKTCDSNGHCVSVAGGSCGSLTFEGQCNETKTQVSWCEGDTINTQDCTEYGSNYVCAWLDDSTGYWCTDACTAGCLDKECGDDGCGGTCGTCTGGQNCHSLGICIGTQSDPCGSLTIVGVCEGDTLKYCAGQAIHQDNCGQYGQACGWSESNDWYECLDPTSGCTPNCTLGNGNLNECADDGCGTVCGICPSDATCSSSKCSGGSASSGCGGLTSKGTCEGGILKFCFGGQLQTVDCATLGKVCTYSAAMDLYQCQ